MASWTLNPIMEWSFDGGTTWHKVSDHGRSGLNVSVRRIENSQQMANGRTRRYVVAKKYEFSTGWENLPDKETTFLANGKPGEWMEQQYQNVDRSFHMRLRAGSDRDTTFTGLNGKIFEVMFTEFSKEITKRGSGFDLWNVELSLIEV